MRYDRIKEVQSVDHIEEVQKFNPYHDERGRFANANRFASFTNKPGKSKAHDLAIARENARLAAQATAVHTTWHDKMTDKELEQKYGEWRYHATTDGAVESIAREGLKPNQGHMTIPGVYFAPTVTDATDWTDMSTGGKTVLRVKTVKLIRDYEYGDIDETEGSTESPNAIKPSLIEIKAPASDHWVGIEQYVKQGGYNFSRSVYDKTDDWEKAGAMGNALSRMSGKKRQNAIKEFTHFASDVGWDDDEIDMYIYD